MEDWEEAVILLRGSHLGGCSFDELVDRLMAEFGWDRARATKAIEMAIEKGGLVLADGRLTLKTAQPPGPGDRHPKP